MTNQLYNFNEEALRKFYFLIRPSKGYFLEIRIMNTTNYDKRIFWNKIGQLRQSSNLIGQTSQFFIDTYEQLLKIIQFDDYFFSKNTKICYGVSERRYRDGEIFGSYEHIDYVRFAYFDIETKNGIKNDEMLEYFTQQIQRYLMRYNLFHPTKVDSGIGTHLIYKIPPQKITDPKKAWYKEFIEELCKEMTNPFYKLDPIKDFTRVLGLPETMNVKRSSKVETIDLSTENNYFLIKSKRLSSIKTISPANIYLNTTKDSELQKIMKLLSTEMPEDAEVNNIVWFYFKVLLRDIGIDFNKIPKEYQDFRRQVERLQHYNFPFNKPEDKYVYSSRKLNDFCKENNIKGIVFGNKT